MSGENSPNDPSATNVPAVPPAPGEALDAAAAAGSAPPAPQPAENVLRGALMSLIALPLGVIVFTLIWNLGFISAIVGFGVAFAAFFLYRLGSGGRVSIKGAIVVTLVTLVTLVASFVFANISDIATVYADTFGVSWFEAMTSPEFGPLAFGLLFSSEGIAAVAGDAGLTLLFGLLGCFAVLRGVFKDARAASAPPVAPPAA